MCDREKLIKLLCEANSKSVDAELFEDSSYAQQFEMEADYLISNGVTFQQWIPVTERLPVQPPNRVDEQGRSWFTTGIECIVYDSENVLAAHYCFQNKCFWYADTLHPLKNITHWTPLPEPPKEA